MTLIKEIMYWLTLTAMAFCIKYLEEGTSKLVIKLVIVDRQECDSELFILTIEHIGTDTLQSSLLRANLYLIMFFQSESIGKSPLFLMLPVAVTCSFAYVLPVSTPPNAMVYATGKLSIADLVSGDINLGILTFVFIVLFYTQS